jgi:hypothetical protein
LGVVILDKLSDRLSDLFDIAKDFPIDGLLFEGTIEPLCDPIGFGLCHKGKAGHDPPESHLIYEMI